MNTWEASFLTEKARKKALYRNVFRLIGKETPVYTLDVIAKSGDIFSLEIDTKPYIKDERVVGEIGIVKIAKKVIHEIGNTELLNKFEKLQKKSTDRDMLKQEIRRITGKWRESQSELDEKNYEIRGLQDELERTQHALELQKRKLDELREELGNNQSVLDEKNLEVEQIKSELEKNQGDLAEKENQLNVKNKEITQLQKKLKDRNNILEEMKTLLIERRIIPLEENEEADQLQYHELKMVVEKLLQKDEI